VDKLSRNPAPIGQDVGPFAVRFTHLKITVILPHATREKATSREKSPP
jgi:hypothetical protein